CKEKSGRVNEDRENFNLLAKGMRFSYRITRPRKVVCRQIVALQKLCWTQTLEFVQFLPMSIVIDR
ncbi:Uncharacterized protein APZ42_009465, partial [Daphnia magna]